MQTLGAEVAEVACAPAGLDVPVATTVIDDPSDPADATDLPGGMLLLVGSAPDDEQALRAIRRVRDRGYTALVAKRHGRSIDALREAAQAADLALIVAADEIPWRHLDALISSALASGVSERSDEARGEELFSIANAVAAVVGGSVAIEDLAQQVLAYSSIEGQRIDLLRRQGILDRRVPRGPQDQEMYRQVLSASGVVRFPQLGDDLPRAAAGIRAGSLPLGTLWAIEGEAGLPAQAEAAVLDGARLAALHMLRAHNALDLDRLRRGEVLRALLERTRSAEDAWSRLGFGPDDPACLIGVAPGWGSDGLLVTNVAREVTRICSALRPDAPVSTIARGVYVLVTGAHAADAARRLAGRLVRDGSRALGGQIYAALSSERPGPRAIPSLRDQVDQILRINAGGLPAPEIATLDEVRTQLLLLAVRDELDRRPELGDPGLARLLEHDERRRSQLTASLLTWLETDQNVHAAAARLHVHPNTLRYRLRRSAEIAGLDLDDADQRLAAWLELRLRGNGAR